MSHSFDVEGSSLSDSEQHTGRALLAPNEVRTMDPDLQLLFLAGQHPYLIHKLRYYADLEFSGLFVPN